MRNFRFLFFVAAIATNCNAQGAQPEGAAPLAMFRGDLAHSGIYRSEGPVTLPRQKWRFQRDGKIIGSPAVADGSVYFGNTSGSLFALDAATGTPRWEFKAEARIASSPAVTADSVYFMSYDDHFYALDRSSGKLKWKFKTVGEHRYTATNLHGHLPAAEAMPDPFDVYLSSPAVWSGTVYFGSGDGLVYALDEKSGGLKWKFKTGDVVHSSPAVVDGTLYIGSWDSYLYALDARSGRQKWRFKTGEDPQYHNQVGIQSSPAVVDGVVYFGCRDNHVYAVDAASGRKLWSVANDESWVNTSPAVVNGKVYYGTADTNRVRVLDARTGAMIKDLTIGPWYFFSSPAIAGNMIYIGSWDGRLYGIDRTSYDVRWTFQTEGSKQNLPRFLKPNGKRQFYVPQADGFYDDLVTSVNAQFSMGTFLSSPVVADGVLYIGSTDGNLYALE